MAQDHILMLLKKYRGSWFSAKDFSKELGINKVSASKNVSRIVKFKDMYGVDVRSGKFRKFLIRLK